MLDNQIVPRSKTVEIKITQTAGTLQFPTNLDDLNNANIYGVIAITATEMTTSPQGNTVTAASDLPKAALTLAKFPGSDKKIDTIPLYTLDRTLNQGLFTMFKPFKWNPSASGVNILATGLTANQAFVFIFLYVPLNSNGQEINE